MHYISAKPLGGALLMAKHMPENQTFISLQDALQLWKDTERHYDVRVELVASPPKMVRESYVQYLCLSGYKASGTAERVCVGSFGLEYPSVNARTYPIALVTLLNRLHNRLEERTARKKAQQAQLGLFD